MNERERELPEVAAHLQSRAEARRQRERDRYWERVERTATALLAAIQNREGGLCFADMESATESARKLVFVIEQQRAAEEP